MNECNGILSFKYLLNKYRACASPPINQGKIRIIYLLHIYNWYLIFSVVRKREDGVGMAVATGRNWSLESNAMLTFVGISDQQNKSVAPFCTTAREVSTAGNNAPFQMPCRIKWMDADTMCTVFSQYSSILWEGDSLTRHLTSGLLMLLNENFRHGATMVPWFGLGAYDKCACDGQFSESLVCRNNKYHTNFSTSEGLCIDVENFARPLFGLNMENEYPYDVYFCKAAKERKPVSILIGHAIHFRFNFERFLKQFFAAKLSNISAASLKCKADVKVIVLGGSATSKLLWDRYRDQRDEYPIAFNKLAREYIDSHTTGVEFFDSFSIAVEAIESRSSDGVHLLSDANAMKVMVVLNLMNKMLNSTYPAYSYHP